jgi:para-aminobenzoate synthetase / 4-amino-4-deoxychorismate lyase
LKAAVRQGLSGARKLRLLLDRDGVLTCTATPLRSVGSAKPRRIGLARSPVNSCDPFLYHKTTHRRVYEEALASRVDCDEVILWNEKGELTEACTANLVLEIGGQRYTPPVRCGLLAGTCRAWMLREGLLAERVLTLRDLRAADRVYLANSVRGLQEAYE